MENDVIKKKKIVILLVCCTFLAIAIIVATCIMYRNVIVYKYNNNEVKAGITIEKSEYYNDKLVIYGNGFDRSMEVSGCYDDMLKPIDDNFSYDISTKKIIISIEAARRISGVYIKSGDVEYKIRYLDSDQYAMIWSEFVCDIGIVENGNIDAYYTSQELESMKAVQIAEDIKLSNNFSPLEGNWESENEFITFRCEGDSFYLLEGMNSNKGASIIDSPIYEISLGENKDGSMSAEVICGGGSEQRRTVYLISSDRVTITDKYAPNIIYKRTDKSIEQWQENVNYFHNRIESLEEDLALVNEYCLMPVELGATTDLSDENKLKYSQDMPYTFYDYNPEEGMDVENFKAYGYYYEGDLRCTLIDTTNPNIEIMMFHTGVNIEDATECMVDFFGYTVHDPVSNPIDGEFVEFTHNLIHVVCFIDSDTREIRRIYVYLENLADYVE